MKLSSLPLEKLAIFIRNGLNISNRQGIGGIPITRIETISEHVINPARVGYAGVEPGDRDEWLLQRGDILFSHINSVAHLGKCALYEGSPGQLIHGMNLLSIRPKIDLVLPQYLLQALRSAPFREQLAKHVKPAVNQASVSIGALKTLDVLVPPISDQHRIAEILDKADAIRRKRQEAIALTEQLLRSTFLEMFGDPVTNPKGWPTAPLEDLAAIGSGVMKGRDYATVETVKRPYMRVANVQDGYLNLNEVKTIEIPKSEAEKYLLQNGDLLLTEGGDPDKLGRGAIWREQIPQCIHQNHIFRVRPLQSNLTSEYLSALLGSAYGKRYFLRAAKQTTGIASINRTQLSHFPVLLPSLESQRMYNRFAAQHQNMTRIYQRLNTEADNLFNSLAQRAFTGQL